MRLLVLAVLLLLACGQAGAQTPLLAPAATSPFDVGGPSGQVLLSDLDDDGHLDLVTRHQQARAIRIHRGDGRARFTTTRTIALRFAPTDMRLGDVNGDDALDLVVTATDRDLVDVLLGDGSAAFRRAVGSPFAASRNLYRYNKRSLHLVDVDEDGHLDLVTANRRGQYAFRFLLGNGRGRFAAGPVLRVAPANEGYTLAFGDVDRDGHGDVVTAVSSTGRGRVDVHLATGRGAFRKVRRPVAVPATYYAEALVDLNADRRPDLVLSHRDARVSILLNRGKGRFAPASGSPFRLETRPFALVPADIDGDSRVDLVGAAENRVIVRLGNARQASFPAGPGAFDVAVGDVDEDGSPDVVASNFESDAVTVLLGRY